MDFSDPPMRKGPIDWISNSDCIHIYPLLNISGAFFQVIPISIAVLIKCIHIVHPPISSLLVEDRVLMQLLTDDLLAQLVLVVLVVVAAVSVEVAVFAAAVRTLDCMVD